ncbi:MAG TPA: hypothetical protein VFW30_09710 [Bryocella sp.]|nr:hypothetical protein [Bryocella sp.]
MRKVTFRLPVTFAVVLCLGIAAVAQKTQEEPATDSAAQASPIKPAPAAPVDDAAAQASPIRMGSGHGESVPPHSAIEVKLSRGIDSGTLKNGETVQARLSQPVTLSPRGTLPVGTPVELTVVETLPAGRLYAAGEFSLQAERVGSVGVYTNTLTYRGKPGHKDLADSAPAVGTDAGLAAGAALTFHVLPPPAPATGPARARNGGPGSVNGVASGVAPPPGSSKQPDGSAGKTNGAQVRQITPAANKVEPAQNLGKPSPAPNQPAPPTGASSTETTQPHP